jgi:hypothetical protein
MILVVHERPRSALMVHPEQAQPVSRLFPAAPHIIRHREYLSSVLVCLRLIPKRLGRDRKIPDSPDVIRSLPGVERQRPQSILPRPGA